MLSRAKNTRNTVKLLVIGLGLTDKIRLFFISRRHMAILSVHESPLSVRPFARHTPVLCQNG